MARITLRLVDGSESANVNVTHAAGDVTLVEHGGLRHEAHLIPTGPGQGVLRLADRAVSVYFSRLHGRVQVWCGGRVLEWERVSGSRRAGAAVGAVAQEQLLSPMPGTIQRVCVVAGGVFAAHQPLIVMISMKMEMSLSVPHAGRVREVLCAEGQLVQMGAVLARLEAVDGPSAT